MSVALKSQFKLYSFKIIVSFIHWRVERPNGQTHSDSTAGTRDEHGLYLITWIVLFSNVLTCGINKKFEV